MHSFQPLVLFQTDLSHRMSGLIVSFLLELLLELVYQYRQYQMEQ